MTAPDPTLSADARREKSHRRIVLVLAVSAVAFACGGGAMLLRTFLGAPGDPRELPVSSALPLEVGDRLVLHVEDRECDVELLSVLEDGRVLLVPCASDGVPATVPRESLRARTYRRDAEPRPRPGDVVASTRTASPSRWIVVEATKRDSLCVRPAETANAPCRDVPRAGLVRLRPAH